jgi:DNA polymerase III subunit delta'
MFSDIIGHLPQKQYLQKVVEQNTASHAYFFSGSRSLGKLSLAKVFAEALLGIESGSLLSHPDVTLVQTQESSISVEEIRLLREHLRLSSLSNGPKIAIIDQAHKMTIAAQNALLKTLEEPSAGTIVILIADTEDALLATIRSRCVQLSFSRVLGSEILSQLEKRGVREVSVEQIVRISCGRPGIAIALMDEDHLNQEIEKIDSAKSFLQLSQAEKIAKAGAIIKASESKEELLDVVHTWEAVLHDALVVSSESETKKISFALKACARTISAIKRNVSPNLAIEYFILRI